MSATTSLLLLLVLNLLWARSQAQSSLPTASIEPTYKIVAPGDSVTFTCTVNGATSGVTWRRNNALITDDADNDIDSAMNQLTVNNFASNLAGNYTCAASNDVGSVSSSTAVLQLAVHDANFFSSEVMNPHQVTVQAGQPTFIDCGPFTNIPNTNLNWEVQFGTAFETVSIANERAVIGLNQSLYLLEPRVSDSGTLFNCILRNDLLSEVAAGYVEITVQGSTSPVPGPHIVVTPQDVTTWLGETVSFECIPGGMDVSNRAATWSTPPGVANSRTSMSGFRLSISDVNANNAGTYTCTIEGVGSYTAALNLIAPPVLESELPTSPISLVYGDPLSLTCASSLGSYWEWFQNGVKLSEVTGPSLQVPSTTLEHSGIYQCITYNSAGNDDSASQVQVMTIPADITEDLPDNQVIFRNEPFSMSCSAGGAPPPTYSWFKGDVPLQTSASFSVGTDGTLQLLEVDSSADGTYRCTATNTLPDGQQVGTDHTTTSITTIMPTIITTTSIGPLFSIQVGTGTILPCQATSDPSSVISYTWTKDGQPLELDERVQLVSPSSSGNLSFSPVFYPDGGAYQCEVRTEHEGLPVPTPRRMDISIVVTDAPVAPHIISVDSSSPNSFQIEYIFSGTPTFISNYTIEIQAPPHEPDTPWLPLQTRSSNAITAVNVSSDMLKAFTLYNVRIVATYRSGIRAPSVPIMVITGSDIPLDAPRDLEVHAPNNMALSLTWKPPSTPRGSIIDYDIQYTMKDADTTNTVSIGSNQTSYVIDGLKEFTRFTVRVAAVTSAGRGPFTEGVESITIEGGLQEPESDSFVTTIGFIVLMVALGLVLLVSVVVGALVIRYRCHKPRNSTKGRYHVRNSIFGSKIVVGTEAPDVDDTNLSESAVASYTARHKRAFDSRSPSGSDPLEATLEGESSFGGTITTGTPQLSMGSSARLLNSQAPSYIDPPSFEETLIKARSRSQSASSGYGNRDVDRPTREWANEQGQTEMGVFNPNNPEYAYDDSDNSIEKDPMDTASDVTYTDQQSDHTQYSHLAGVNVNPSAVFHHQLSLPRSAGSSSGGAAPVSFSDLVDNRLRAQSSSPDGGSPLNYATYV